DAFNSLDVTDRGPPITNPLQADRSGAEEVRTVILYAPAVGGWPLTYQWKFNPANLAGATNAWLVVEGGLQTQAGLYSVTVSNAWGMVTMPATRLTVVPAILTQPPQDQVVYLGGTARFEAHVKASGPLSYQ